VWELQKGRSKGESHLQHGIKGGEGAGGAGVKKEERRSEEGVKKVRWRTKTRREGGKTPTSPQKEKEKKKTHYICEVGFLRCWVVDSVLSIRGGAGPSGGNKV